MQMTLKQVIGTAVFIATLPSLPVLAQESAPITSCNATAFHAKYPILRDKTVVIALDPNTVPYAMIDLANGGALKGSDVELAAAIFDCMGVKYEYRQGAWPGLFPAVLAGQADVMFYLFYNAKRAEQADFITYMNTGSGAIVATGNPKNIKSQADLCGKIVSAGLGTVEERQAQDWSDECVKTGREAISVMTSTDVTSGFRLIASGRADVMVSDLPLLNMMVERNPSVYEIGYTAYTNWKISAAVANDSPLGPALHEAMLLIQAQGKDQQIFEKYGIDNALLTKSEFLPH